MSPQVFLHRAQRWGNGGLLMRLDSLCADGVQAFELDMMWRLEGFCIGHPAHHENQYDTEPTELSKWALKRGVTILLDVKRMHTREFGRREIEQFFSQLCPKHFLVASYDLPFAATIGNLSGLAACGIVSAPVRDLNLDLTLILPDRAAGQLPRAYRKEKVIVSCIESLGQVQRLLTEGFSRFMTDNLEIAVSATRIS